MRVTLQGPDELGFCVLTDDDGNTYPLVTKTEDFLYAAKLFGWTGGTIDEAIDYVTEMNGEEIEAPPQIEEFFLRLYAELEAEDSDE